MRIEALEDNVQAWTCLDPDYALDQARRADQARQSGRPQTPNSRSTHPARSGTRKIRIARPAASARLLATASQEPPLPPNLVFVKTPVWEAAETDCRAAFAELVETLDGQVDEFQLPGTFDNAVTWHKTIMHADLAKSLAREYTQGKEQLSDRLRAMIEEGQGMLAVDYNRAVDWIGVLNGGLEEVFERYDAIVTPAAPGQAPRGLDATGNPVFCTLWTYLGLPAVSLPLLQGDDGLPIGVQLVGARGDDARLLRTARWLVAHLRSEEQG